MIRGSVMRKKLYLSLAIVGTILPYYFLVSFLFQYGWDIHRIWDQLFLSELGAFFVMDVLISSIVLLVFVFAEGRRVGMRNLWIYIVANLVVGVSLAFPLFLYSRENYVRIANA
jgi:hypothetical protein